MRKFALICALFIPLALPGAVRSLEVRGTLSTYASALSNYDSGTRFIPVLEAGMLPDTARRILDLEISADSYVRYDTAAGLAHGFDPYRAWHSLPVLSRECGDRPGREHGEFRHEHCQ